MSEPRTFEFEARWADGGGNTGIEVSPQRSPGGTEVWINVGGNTAEVLISPREAVKLAHALLTIAATEAGTAAQVDVGAGFAGARSGPDRKAWLFKAELDLT